MNQIKIYGYQFSTQSIINLFLSSLVESLAFSEKTDVSPEGGGGD